MKGALFYVVFVGLLTHVDAHNKTCLRYEKNELIEMSSVFESAIWEFTWKKQHWAGAKVTINNITVFPSKWLFNEYNVSENGTFTVETFLEKDEGVYFCKTTSDSENGVKADEKTCLRYEKNELIEMSSVFESGIWELSWKKQHWAGAKVTINNITAVPSKWLFNEYNVSENGTFTVETFLEKDEGVYFCKTTSDSETGREGDHNVKECRPQCLSISFDILVVLSSVTCWYIIYKMYNLGQFRLFYLPYTTRKRCRGMEEQSLLKHEEPGSRNASVVLYFDPPTKRTSKKLTQLTQVSELCDTVLNGDRLQLEKTVSELVQVRLHVYDCTNVVLICNSNKAKFVEETEKVIRQIFSVRSDVLVIDLEDEKLLQNIHRHLDIYDIWIIILDGQPRRFQAEEQAFMDTIKGILKPRRD